MAQDKRGMPLSQPCSSDSSRTSQTPTRPKPPPTQALNFPATRRPFNCCKCAVTSRHGGATCLRCNHLMCSECQVSSIETDIVINPISAVRPTLATANEQEQTFPVSSSTRSAKKKKFSVLELGKMLEKSASLTSRMGENEAGPNGLNRRTEY